MIGLYELELLDKELKEQSLVFDKIHQLLVQCDHDYDKLANKLFIERALSDLKKKYGITPYELFANFYQYAKGGFDLDYFNVRLFASLLKPIPQSKYIKHNAYVSNLSLDFSFNNGLRSFNAFYAGAKKCAYPFHIDIVDKLFLWKLANTPKDKPIDININLVVDKGVKSYKDFPGGFIYSLGSLKESADPKKDWLTRIKQVIKSKDIGELRAKCALIRCCFKMSDGILNRYNSYWYAKHPMKDNWKYDQDYTPYMDLSNSAYLVSLRSPFNFTERQKLKVYFKHLMHHMNKFSCDYIIYNKPNYTMLDNPAVYKINHMDEVEDYFKQVHHDIWLHFHLSGIRGLIDSYFKKAFDYLDCPYKLHYHIVIPEEEEIKVANKMQKREFNKAYETDGYSSMLGGRW